MLVSRLKCIGPPFWRIYVNHSLKKNQKKKSCRCLPESVFFVYRLITLWHPSVRMAMDLLLEKSLQGAGPGPEWYGKQRRLLGIPRDERICTVCDSCEVGDEFRYLLNCSNENVKRNRIKYVDKYYTHHPKVPKFCSLMNMTSKSKNVKRAKFISCIFELSWLSQ